MSGWMLAALLGGLILLGLAVPCRHPDGAPQIASRDANSRLSQACNERILRVSGGHCPRGTGWSCDYSRRCHRLTNLLDALPNQERSRLCQVPGLYGLYEKVKEMPTHEARWALKRNEVMKMDLEHGGYEAELEADQLRMWPD